MKKTINISIPVTIAQSMDDRGLLNPEYIGVFLDTFIQCPIDKEDINQLLYRYSFKIDGDIHKKVKARSIEGNLSIADFTAQLFHKYY